MDRNRLFNASKGKTNSSGGLNIKEIEAYFKHVNKPFNKTWSRPRVNKELSSLLGKAKSPSKSPSKCANVSCTSTKICNPKSGRCVLKTGKIGQTIKAKTPAKVKTPSPNVATRTQKKETIVRTVLPDGEIEYHRGPLLHRRDGPAFERPDGSEEWFINSQLHRFDGPAVTNADGTREWWLYGEPYANVIGIRKQIEYISNLPAKIKSIIRLYTRSFDNINTASTLTIIEAYVQQTLLKVFTDIPPLESELTVYRGLNKIPISTFKSQFTSTTLSLDSARMFMDPSLRDNKKCCMMQIKIPRGSKILPLLDIDVTYFPQEKEILLPPGGKFDTSSEPNVFNYSYKIGGIHLRYIPFDLYISNYTGTFLPKMPSLGRDAFGDLIYLFAEIDPELYTLASDRRHYLTKLAKSLKIEVDISAAMEIISRENLENRLHLIDDGGWGAEISPVN